MSPRAAWRLRTLGFEEVYDYAGGKEDWLAFGLPREGSLADVLLAGDLACADAPTCGLRDDLHEVRTTVERSGWDTCLVVNDDGVVLGRVGRRALREGGEATAGEVMTDGPGTVRPSELVEPLLERMRARNMTTVPVTTPDGRLVGVLRLEDAERRG